MNTLNNSKPNSFADSLMDLGLISGDQFIQDITSIGQLLLLFCVSNFDIQIHCILIDSRDSINLRSFVEQIVQVYFNISIESINESQDIIYSYCIMNILYQILLTVNIFQ